MRALTTSFITLFLIAFCIHNGMGYLVPYPEPGVNVGVNVNVNKNGGGMDSASGCPEDANTFYLSASNQCFRIYFQKKNWEDASMMCTSMYGKDDNMGLAHPYNAVALRKYMIERFTGDKDYNEVWLNARGNGKEIVWQGGDMESISKDNTNWFKGQPSDTSDSYCLKLLVNAAKEKEEPNSPYWVDECDTVYKYPLCEVRMMRK